MALRILMYSTYFPPQYSGAAKQALSLAKELRSIGHHIEFLTLRQPNLSKHEIIEGFQVWRIETNNWRHKEFCIWKNMFLFVNKRRNDFDVFHSHGSYYLNSIVGPFAKIFRWKSIVKASLAENDLFGIKSSITGMIQYLFLKMVDGYIATSQDLVNEYKESGLPGDRIHHIPNGVDTGRFKPVSVIEKDQLKKAYGLPVKKLIALSVGVLDQRKNIGWLMDQWAKNERLYSRAFLLVIGPQSREDHQGQFYNFLKKMASKHYQKMKMVDPVEDIETYYQASDIFILPSKGEGMPNVVLEALSSGMPCVATRVSGTNELIQEGQTGYLFDHSCLDDFATAFSRISEKDLQSMGERCRRRMEKSYSIRSLAQKYETLYEKMVQRI